MPPRAGNPLFLVGLGAVAMVIAATVYLGASIEGPALFGAAGSAGKFASASSTAAADAPCTQCVTQEVCQANGGSYFCAACFGGPGAEPCTCGTGCGCTVAVCPGGGTSSMGGGSSGAGFGGSSTSASGPLGACCQAAGNPGSCTVDENPDTCDAYDLADGTQNGMFIPYTANDTPDSALARCIAACGGGGGGGSSTPAGGSSSAALSSSARSSSARSSSGTPADIKVSVVCSCSGPGQQKCTVTTENLGPGTAKDVSVQFFASGDVEIVSYGGLPATSPTSVQWVAAQLMTAPGSSARDVIIRQKPGTAGNGSVAVSATASTPDPVSSNNTASPAGGVSFASCPLASSSGQASSARYCCHPGQTPENCILYSNNCPNQNAVYDSYAQCKSTCPATLSSSSASGGNADLQVLSVVCMSESNGQQTCNVSVKNNGPSAATDVKLTLNATGNIKLVSAFNQPAASPTQTVVNLAQSLAAGGTAQATVVIGIKDNFCSGSGGGSSTAGGASSQGAGGSGSSNPPDSSHVWQYADQCSDTDGLNYSVQGTVTATQQGTGVPITVIDACGGPQAVIEFHCRLFYGGTPDLWMDIHYCPTGQVCSAGACVNGPIPACWDSDGDNPYNRGHVRVTGETEMNPAFEDKCNTETEYTEYLCVSGNRTSVIKTCPNGIRCRSGLCSPFN